MRSIRACSSPMFLADPDRGLHLVHAMLRPKREAMESLPEFRKVRAVDLGEARVERKGKVGTSH